MWEKINYHKNKIFAIMLFIGIFYWLIVPEEELYDPYTISVDYDCREVVRDPDDIPNSVVEECRILIEEISKQNETRPNKSII
jgi:hypothetical protein